MVHGGQKKEKLRTDRRVTVPIQMRIQDSQDTQRERDWMREVWEAITMPL